MNAAQHQQPTDGGDGEGRRQREVAQRIFAAEFSMATHETKESGEYAPTYVVSPFGARINRLFAVGVLTASENVGQSGDMYKAQIVDPTGTFNVYAGQYQPEAAQALAEIRPPALVAIVGKTRTYSPEEGVTYVSIRPESIRVVDRADRDAWTLEAAKLTLRRLEAVREALKLETPTAKALVDMGFPQDVAEGVVAALAHYGKPDLAKQAQIVRDALESLLPGGAERVAAEPEFATASTMVPRAPAPAPTAGAPTAAPPATPARGTPPPAESAHADLVLGLVEKLDEGKGAPWEDVVAEAGRKNVSEEEVEECLNDLMDKGQVYEPVLGRLKRT